jgi:hypothetical protein
MAKPKFYQAADKKAGFVPVIGNSRNARKRANCENFYLFLNPAYHTVPSDKGVTRCFFGAQAVA